MIFLGEGIRFETIYRPKKLDWCDGKVRHDLQHRFDSETVCLWHYTIERFEGVPRPYSYWSECLTDFPQIAGDATGINDSECLWRIEWRLPLQEALKNLEIGDQRFREIGVFREFCNQMPIEPHAVTWSKMADR